MNLLNISGSPHVHSDESTKKIMWRVNLALVPALIVAITFFGVNALLVSLISVASCVLFQWLIEKFILKQPTTVWDGSAIVTGLLLAFNVPATVDMMWIVVIGALVAIGIAKMAFGGLGKNPFNPAIVGRIFLLISFPVQMTTWPKPGFTMSFDAATGATPLGAFKEGALPADVTLMDAFLGHIGGSMGEISAIAILLGAIYLLCRKIITWHIPVAFIGTAFVFSGILWLVNPETYMDPVMTIFTGGIMLGACFMATDMVTSPMAKSGQLIFGFGCGLLTIVIRNWGAYPEGVSFAILIMNGVTPLLNRWCKPKRFAV
ncbi:MAG: RnfABCDGE type electron transport complex subunit D [Bacteroidales bacterium]|nr:RnfABCDGE type electron transport complex subunit D [Bacteroidales bacterium]MBR4773493.1 RnfABCDGE type electron transport complex subunit D [Bacteroidales bacterium]MBR5093009.1 RnfABCDGE type electron transport complex subunit D [Bacteroidales bacterium]